MSLFHLSKNICFDFQESGLSDNMSDNASPEPPAAKAVSPTESEEMKKSTGSANSGSIRGNSLKLRRITFPHVYKAWPPFLAILYFFKKTRILNYCFRYT